MNRIRSSLLLKTILSISTVILAVSIVFCTLIIGVFSVLEAYTDPDEFIESVDSFCLTRDFAKIRSNLIAYHDEIISDDPLYDNDLSDDPVASAGSVVTLSSRTEVIEPVEDLRPENTNVRFMVFDDNGSIVLSNTKELTGKTYQEAVSFIKSREFYSESREFSSYEEGSSFFQEIQDKYEISRSDWDITEKNGVEIYTLTLDWSITEYEAFNVRYCYSEEAVVKDSFYTIRSWTSTLLGFRYHLLVADAVGLIVLVLLLVLLCSCAGYQKNQEKPQLNIVDKIPFDIYIPIAFGICALTSVTWYYFINSFLIPEQFFTVLLISFVATLIFGIVILATILTVATRLKTRTLITNTVIARVIRLLWIIIKSIGKLIAYLIRNIPLYVKTAVIIVFFLGVECIILISDLIMTDYGFYGATWCFIAILNAVLIPLSVYCVIQFGLLRRGAKKIAQGDGGYTINSKGMVFEFREHAKTLNNIQDGLQKEVNERIKSERFKTELITNVSHDIKTPLTSIINYVDLLKNEQMPSEVATQYVEVLDRQSVRLKKLINDLIEVSKASTGNITVNVDNPDIGMIINQAYAEFEDKLTMIGVSAVINTPENCKVRADGRLLWRVFDNLIGNVCKYSQENTRFYIDTEVTDDRVIVSMKNTSKYQLNISKDELMERFTRGDASRHTDGSGLGLSIAKSLLELQEGRLDIFIDGDFFKVTVDLPKV